jgi:hypothetical protein
MGAPDGGRPRRRGAGAAGAAGGAAGAPGATPPPPLLPAPLAPGRGQVSLSELPMVVRPRYIPGPRGARGRPKCGLSG